MATVSELRQRASSLPPLRQSGNANPPRYHGPRPRPIPPRPKAPEVIYGAFEAPVMIPHMHGTDYQRWTHDDFEEWLQRVLPQRRYRQTVRILRYYDGSMILTLATDPSVQRFLELDFGAYQKVRSYAAAVVNEHNRLKYHREMMEYTLLLQRVFM